MYIAFNIEYVYVLIDCLIIIIIMKVTFGKEKVLSFFVFFNVIYHFALILYHSL